MEENALETGLNQSFVNDSLEIQPVKEEPLVVTVPSASSVDPIDTPEASLEPQGAPIQEEVIETTSETLEVNTEPQVTSEDVELVDEVLGVEDTALNPVPTLEEQEQEVVKAIVPDMIAPQTIHNEILDNNRYAHKASILDAVSATVSQWDTTTIIEGFYSDNLMDKINKFGEPDPTFDLEEALIYSGTRLSENDLKYLDDRKISNQKELDYFLNVLKERKEDYRAMGASPWTSLAVGFFDPAYLAMGLGVGTAGKAIGVGRVGNMLAVGAGDTAVMGTAMYYNNNITIEDVAGNAILSMLIGGAVGNGTKTPPRTQGDVPEMNARFGEYVYTPEGSTAQLRGYNNPQVVNVDNIAYEFSTPTYTQSYGANIKIDTNGNAYTEMTGRMRIDTPKGASEIKGIDMEIHQANPIDTDVSTWKFKPEFKDTWRENTYTDGLPRYNTIDWNSTTPQGTKLKDTAFHQMYRTLDSPDVDPAIKAITSKYLMQTSESLIRTGSKLAYRKPTKGSTRVLGKYNPRSNEMQVNIYKGNKEHVPYTTNHEAMHSLLVHKIAFGRDNPTTVHGQLVQKTEELRKHIKKTVAETPHLQEMIRKLDGKFAFDYAIQNVDEFMSSIAELSSKELRAFREVLDSIELPENLRTNLEPEINTPLKYLMNTLRKLLGLDLNEANALFRALKLQNDLLKTPEVKIYMDDGSVRYAQVDDPRFAEIMREITIEEFEKLASIKSENIGTKVQWNAYDTFAGWDADFAMKFLDDPLSNVAGNAQDLKRAYQSDFQDKFQVRWETLVQELYTEAGIKWYDRIFNPNKVRDVQTKLSNEVVEALIHIEAGNTPTFTNPKVKEITDLLNEFGLDARDKLVDKGLLHKGALEGNGGYFSRQWNGSKVIDTVENLSNQLGIDHKEALNMLARQFGNSIQYAGMDAQKRFIYARAILDRSMRIATDTDLTFRGHLGLDTAFEIRDAMSRYGASPKEIDDIMDIVEGRIAQAGQDRWQKARMDINMLGDMNINGEIVKIHDFIQKDHIFQDFDRYIDNISGRMAMADHGVYTRVDIDKLKNQVLTNSRKAKADPDTVSKYFDDVMNQLQGKPVGEPLEWQFRMIGGLAQMMALRNSGFWQVTEVAKAYARGLMVNGFSDTNRALFRAFGDYNAVKDPAVARDLNHILSRKAWNDVRLRPLINRFEDGHVNSKPAIMGLSQAQGMVYHLNGMVAVQRLQANFVANVLVTTLERGAKGDPRIRAHLARYGLDDAVLDLVKREIDTHGLTVDNWSPEVWGKVNPALTKIMDTDVLRARTGNIPLILQFSSAGRILGTFQNFTFTAHNKILANTLVNDGYKGLALLLAVQMPLAMLMTQASAVSAGRGAFEDPIDWVNASLGQMGSLGLFVEAINIITGNSKGYGGAFMIPLNTAGDVLTKAFDGDFAGATEKALKNVPLVGLLPAWGLGVSTAFQWNDSE